jgi:hypothetical protein
MEELLAGELTAAEIEEWRAIAQRWYLRTRSPSADEKKELLAIINDKIDCGIGLFLDLETESLKMCSRPRTLAGALWIALAESILAGEHLYQRKRSRT